MIRIIILLTTALYCTSFVAVNKTNSFFKVAVHSNKDTLPIIDTVGEGNWQYSLRKDSLINNRDSIDARFRRDSL